MSQAPPRGVVFGSWLLCRLYTSVRSFAMAARNLYSTTADSKVCFLTGAGRLEAGALLGGGGGALFFTRTFRSFALNLRWASIMSASRAILPLKTDWMRTAAFSCSTSISGVGGAGVRDHPCDCPGRQPCAWPGFHGSEGGGGTAWRMDGSAGGSCGSSGGGTRLGAWKRCWTCLPALPVERSRDAIGPNGRAHCDPRLSQFEVRHANSNGLAFNDFTPPPCLAE